MAEYEPTTNEIVFSAEKAESVRELLSRTLDSGVVATDRGLPLTAFLHDNSSENGRIDDIAIPVEATQELQAHGESIKEAYEARARESRRTRMLGKIGIVPLDVVLSREVVVECSEAIQAAAQHEGMAEAPSERKETSAWFKPVDGEYSFSPESVYYRAKEAKIARKNHAKVKTGQPLAAHRNVF